MPRLTVEVHKMLCQDVLDVMDKRNCRIHVLGKGHDMMYKVVIKRCCEPLKAERIADEIAKRSGNSIEQVYSVITKKNICIKKEAPLEEAEALKILFENIGAEIDLVELSGATLIVNKTIPEEEEEEQAGRILSADEFVKNINRRADIFAVDRDTRLRNLELVSMGFAIGLGIFLTTREINADIMSDCYEKNLGCSVATVSTVAVVKPQETPVPEKKPSAEKVAKSDKRSVKRTHSKGDAANSSGGGGDPRARVTKKGILGIINGQIKGRSVASADIFAKGGFATDIDAVLQGMGGLKNNGSGGVGRRGAAGIGFGAGYGSGFGGGSNLGNPIDGLIPVMADADIKMKPVGGSPHFTSGIRIGDGAALVGGRSKGSIMRVVMQNIAALRYAYNKSLRDKPGLKGKVTVKFAIDEFGKVIFSQVVESSMGDAELETAIVDKVKRWVFEKIDKPGDVTEVVYPFVFSQ